MCKDKGCIRCGGIVSKERKIPHCSECLSSTLAAPTMYYEPICDKYFCPKCLRTRVQSNSSISSECTLSCGHKVARGKLEGFLRGRACYICGTGVSEIDYDLINDEKCCYSCFKYEQQNLDGLLLVCLGCDQVIKNIINVGKMDDGFILCKNCVTQSQL